MIAAIYARKSTDQSSVSDEQKSVARQIEHARAYADRKGWTVAAEHQYVDDGISGAEFANRPGFLRLMNALKPRAPFQVLIMSEESRLGREQLEVGYALKQIIQAGVRVFFHLEDRERTLNTPTDKIMLSLTTFADELEREKGRQRTYDAMQRKARAGHVTGGQCFGFRNVEVVGPDGRRSHVRREVHEPEAVIVRRIFNLSATGHGLKSIAKMLNDEGAPSPRAQRGRSSTWAPSSVREVLFRTAYRGTITWNATRKRDRWGHHHQVGRPANEWITVPAPELRIVTEAQWQAAHARLDASRRLYLKGTKGQPFGRPPVGSASPYLLTNFASCGQCGGPLRVRTRKQNSRTRVRFYGCAGYHERGRTVCTNSADVPMPPADDAVLSALLDDVLTPDVIRDAVDEALMLVCQDSQGDRLGQIDADIQTAERERDRLVAAVAAGGQLDGLLSALQDRERRLTSLQQARASIAGQRRTSAREAGRVRKQLIALAGQWREALAQDVENARPILSGVLVDRVTVTPMEPGRWQVSGRGTVAGLFSRDVFPSEWRPHRESNPGLGLERAAS